MFGLKKEPQEPFQFDLETDLRKDPEKMKMLLKQTEEHILKIKNLFREGTDTDIDDYGKLLHGYMALQKILKKLAEKK